MKIRANGIDIEIDDTGPRDGPVLMLIMGLGMQLIAWPDELVQDLVGRGFRVVRLDNRDIGLSQRMDHLGMPNVAWAMLRHAVRLPIHSPYRVSDMANDAVGVLDHLGIASAHICGASMGGMIAQHLAASHPRRVRSLTLMMTTTGSRRLPQASLRIRQALVARPASTAFADLVAHSSALYRLIGSPAYPPDEARLKLRLETSIKRAFNPAGTARQLLAIAADGDRSAMLARISAPTLVIHGIADPLVPVQAGHDLAQRIAGAQTDFIEGMGHDLPLALLPRFASGIAANASRAAARATSSHSAVV